MFELAGNVVKLKPSVYVKLAVLTMKEALKVLTFLYD
jgi:hypothetical protein